MCSKVCHKMYARTDAKLKLVLRRRPPSVSGDLGCTRFSQLLSLHLLVWLCRPMREWQSLPHRRQMWAVAAWSVELDLRVALFSIRWSGRSCLACLVPRCTAAIQESRDSARLSHDWISIAALFRSLLQVSLNRSLGRPLDLGPPESFPYSKSLGIRPSSRAGLLFNTLFAIHRIYNKCTNLL